METKTKIILVTITSILVIIGGIGGYFLGRNVQLKDNNYQNEKENNIPSTTELSKQEKTEIAKTLRDNACLYGVLFENPNINTLDFNDFQTRIAFIRNYVEMNRQLGNYDDQDNVKYIETEESSYSLNIFIKKDYLKEKSEYFFNITMKDEEFKEERSHGEYYDTALIPDGGCHPSYFFPVLNKRIYDEETKTYSLYTINYRKIEEGIDYPEIIEISDEELKNINKDINYTIIKYQKLNDRIILLSVSTEAI